MILWMFFLLLLLPASQGDYPPPEAEIRRSPPPPGSESEAVLPTPPRPLSVSCSRRNSCGPGGVNARLPFYTRNCFCDALCRTYDDCCSDYRPETASTGSGSGLQLPRGIVSCARVEEIDTAYEIYIVTRCPRGFANAFVRDRCEDERIAGEFYRLPVSGARSGVLYRNAYCAMCANETAFLFWRMAHVCVSGAGGAEVPDVRRMMRCPPELLPPEVEGIEAAVLRPRKCKSHVTQCQRGRRQRGGGRGGRRRCRGPTAYVYDGLQVYRNAECAACNGVPLADCYDERTPKIDMDALRRELYAPPLPASAVVLLIDLNAAAASVHRRVPRADDDDAAAAAVAVTPLAACPAGQLFDPYAGVCRPVGCSADGSAPYGSSACPSTASTTTDSTTTTPTTTMTTTTSATTTTTTTTTTTATPTTTTTSTESSSIRTPRTARPPRRSKSGRRRRTTTTTTTTTAATTTPPWAPFNYDDDAYDDYYYYEFNDYTPHSWEPRDAVLAWQTTPATPYDRQPAWTLPSTTSAEHSEEVRWPPSSTCTIHRISAGDFVLLRNGSLVVAFPPALRGPYSPSHYTTGRAGQLFVCADDDDAALATERVETGRDRERRPGARSTTAAAADLGRHGVRRGSTTLADQATSGRSLALFQLDRYQNLAALVAVLVSMTALSVCVVVYLLLPALRRVTAGRCVVSLALCLFCAQLLHLGAMLHGYGAFVGVLGGHGERHAAMCYWLAAVTHYVLLTAAFWLNVIAMDAARSACAEPQVYGVKSSPPSCVLYFAYSVYAWLAPAVIVGGSLAAEEFQLDEPLLRAYYADAGVCWLAGRRGIPLLFALPLAALTVADLVLFAIAACRLPPSAGAGGGAEGPFGGRRWLIAGSGLAVLVGALWATALAAAYTGVAELWWAFVGLQAAVGLYVCLAYAAMPDVLLMISGQRGSRRHLAYGKAPSNCGGVDAWRNGGVNNGHYYTGQAAAAQSLPRSITYPVTEYDEVISQETSI